MQKKNLKNKTEKLGQDQTELQKNLLPDPGVRGLPEDYPSPVEREDLLFYIQRNQNKNTVVYELNRNNSGEVSLDLPMHAYWIKYTDGGDVKELNVYQDQLAYGYHSQSINSETFEFHFVSYEELKLFIVKDGIKDEFKVVCKINGEISVLSNIYVYAEELGVFPKVEFIELYGQELKSGLFTYEKIIIES